MTCWDGFGNLSVDHKFWVGRFSKSDRSEILFYYPNDQNWWLATFNNSNSNFDWSLISTTQQFGNLLDGHMFWVGSFSRSNRSEMLFYYPGNQDWWLGTFNNLDGKFFWRQVGNTGNSFGNLLAGEMFWIGNFTRSDRSDVLIYFPANQNWQLGTFNDSTQKLDWKRAGNTSVFGNLLAGHKFWIGNFTRSDRSQVLFYYPGDQNWWLGNYRDSTGQFDWSSMGNTSGFGNLLNGQMFWTGKFSRSDRTQILFYYPGDQNWWLEDYNQTSRQFKWSRVGITNGFGNLLDGHKFWVGGFSRSDRSQILFYYPGDQNWWLGSYNDSTHLLDWSRIGITSGFGNLLDGHMFWSDNFGGSGRNGTLFYYPGDGNWWLGAYRDVTNQLVWNRVSYTGRAHKARVRIHVKILTQPNTPISTMFKAMQQVYSPAGFLVEQASTEDLSTRSDLASLNDLDLTSVPISRFDPTQKDPCFGPPSPEQAQLFSNRNSVGDNEIVVYFVRSTFPAENGCATYPPGQPGVVVTRNATQWTMAHEVGHVLGLSHCDDNPPGTPRLTNRLMTGGGTSTITNPPPDLTREEIQTMDNSNLTINC